MRLANASVAAALALVAATSMATAGADQLSLRSGARIPRLRSTFLKIYSDNAVFGLDEWVAELKAVRAAGLTSVVLPYAADANVKFNSSSVDHGLDGDAAQWAAGAGGCELGTMLSFYPSALPCMANLPDAPVAKLLEAAARAGVSVYLGLGAPNSTAWAHMQFPPANSTTTTHYYGVYGRLQSAIATELWDLYGGKYGGTIKGFYLNMEVGNTLGWMDGRSTITEQFFTPVTQHVRGLSTSSDLETFTSPGVYVASLHGPPTPMTPQQLGEFWDQIFTDAPALSFIAPKDGMGEGKNNASIVTAYLKALRRVSTKHGKPLWSDVELFQGSAGPYKGCAYTSIKPSTIAKISAQMALEDGLVDTMTAWEWHAFMSPVAHQCPFYPAARKLYTDYLAYVHNASNNGSAHTAAAHPAQHTRNV